MGEFSAQWLSLREPVDHAARSPKVRDAMLADLGKRHGKSLTGLRVLDIGCGSGSNLRALAPLLGHAQQWTLVDYDPALLSAARVALKDWSDTVVAEQAQSLSLIRGDARIEVSFVAADLSAELETVLAKPVDLVTASALFDLVSSDWVDRFSALLAAPLYAVLSYDGLMRWEPAQPNDELVCAAFNAHQASDKGFGVALGPRSGQYLAKVLGNRGFDVTIDKSPWQIDALPSPFHDMLASGIAQAVSETGQMQAHALDAWLAAAKVARRCVVGHDDIYAAKA